jgi:hypothetical protein
MPGHFLALASKRGRWSVVLQARPYVGRGARPRRADASTPDRPAFAGASGRKPTRHPFFGGRGAFPKSQRRAVTERGGASIWQRVAEPMGLSQRSE